LIFPHLPFSKSENRRGKETEGMKNSKGCMKMEETTTRHINDNPDSLEIGTPSKGGAIKIYGDFSKPDEFKAKIQKAKEVREEAQKLLG
jgi:hypothetical protein